MLRRALCLIAAFLLSVILSACGGSNSNMVETPANMMMQRGRNYKEVIEDFEDKGFTNIKTEPIEDLSYDWSFKNGQVEQISVGGDTNYDAGVRVPEDTQVIIRYHAYNPNLNKDEEEESGENPGEKTDSQGSEENSTEENGTKDVK